MLFLLLLCTLLPAYAIEGAKFLDVTYSSMKGYWVSEMTDDDVKCAYVIDVEATFFTQRYLCETSDGKKMGAIAGGSIYLTQQLTVTVDKQEFKITFGFLSTNTVDPFEKKVNSDASAIGFALLEVSGAQILIAFDPEEDDEDPTTLIRLKASAFEGVHKCEDDSKQKSKIAFRGPTWTVFGHDSDSDAYYAIGIGAFEAEGSTKVNVFEMLPASDKPESSHTVACADGKCVFTDKDGKKSTCTKVEDSTDDLIGVWQNYDETKNVLAFIVIDGGGVFYQIEDSVVPGESEGAGMSVGSYTMTKKDKVYTIDFTVTDLFAWAKAGGDVKADYLAKGKVELTMTDSKTYTSGGSTWTKVEPPKVAIQFVYLVPEGTTAKDVQSAVIAKTGGKPKDVVVVLKAKSTRSGEVEARASVSGASADDVNKASEITVGGKAVTSTDAAKATSNQPPTKVATSTQTAVKKEEKKSVSSLATFSMAVLVLCALL